MIKKGTIRKIKIQKIRIPLRCQDNFFIYARRTKSAKAVEESHSLSFAAIIGARDGTEGTNSHIRDMMTARHKMSGNMFGVIVIVNRPTVFTKPYP